MNSLVISLAILGLLLIGIVSAEKGNADSDKKMTICHIPPGNPANAHTIVISKNAWPAHQKHGGTSDTIGPCPVTPFCGDGKVNQPSEQCDRKDGVPSGYMCTDTCQLVQRNPKNETTCVQAIYDGKLTAAINGNSATVTNKAGSDFVVSIAAYKMFAPLIEDQLLADASTKTVKAGQSVTLSANVPACGYQLDVVCGDPIRTGTPWYGDRVINFTFANQDNYCPLTKGSSRSGISAILGIAPHYPQNNSYVFTCNANGFSANQYYWYFGDGLIQPGMTTNNVFHTYDAGNYNVACTARNSVDWATDVMPITVQ